MAASLPAAAKEQRLVTRDEIMEAFRFFDAMELQAEDLNLRYQILVDMLFETNPENLRAKLQQLVDNRKERMVLVDRDTGQVAPFDPSMYDELGQVNTQQEQVATAKLQQVLSKPKLRTRLAIWLIGWRA